MKGRAGRRHADSPPSVARVVVAMLVGLLLAGGVPVVEARQAVLSGEELEAQTRAVSAMLRCPVCQGESIQDSPADLAREMRDVVRDQLAAGRTPDEVQAYFVDRYGEWILLAPPARGFNLVLYVLPFAGLVAGAGALLLLGRRWQRQSGAAPAEALVEVAEDEY